MAEQILRYVSITIRSWIRKYLELIKQDDAFNEMCKYIFTDLHKEQDNALPTMMSKTCTINVYYQ